MRKCLACRLNGNPSPVPGGRIAETKHWIVEHCVGPFGIGAVVIKTKAHIESFSECSDREIEEFARLLKITHRALEEVFETRKIYLSKWGEETPHLHVILQPISKQIKGKYKSHGPALQAKMVETGEKPDPQQAAKAAERLKRWFSASRKI